MNKIHNSATRIMLIMFGLSWCVAFLFVVFNNRDNNEVVKNVLFLYSYVTTALVSFYFWQKSNEWHKHDNVDWKIG